MSSIRAEIWCAAFIRRHNDAGQICVVARKGDPIAGQVWIEVDHLDGTSSLFAQAPSVMLVDESDEWVFQLKIDRKTHEQIKDRLTQEEKFDPDFWLLVLENPKGEHGLALLKSTEVSDVFSQKN